MINELCHIVLFAPVTVSVLSPSCFGSTKVNPSAKDAG